MDLLEANEINLNLARLILQEMMNDPRAPEEIANEKGWKQITDEAVIKQICSEVIDSNPKMVRQYQEGKAKVLFAIAGEIAKKTENKINMAKVVDILKEMLQK